MRITEGMMAGDFLYTINKNRAQINKLEIDLASGKRLQKVSDDPTAADAVLRLNAGIDRNDQYQKNVTDGQGVLAQTGSSLDDMGSLLQEVQSIVVQAKDGDQTSVMGSLAERVDQLLNEAVSLANSKFNGKFIFGGTQTTAQPYTLVTNPGPPATQSVAYAGNAEIIHYPTGESLVQQVSVPGSEAFGGTALFNSLIRVRDTLRAGQTPSTDDANAVAAALDTVTQTASKAGSLSQSLDNTTVHLTNQKTQLQVLLSAEQDTDVAEASLNLKQAQTMLDAALASGAQILPKSLLDFLK
jgi:flagellar hook-associated protein 3 FlgL